MFQGCFQEVSWKIQECLKKISMAFQKNFQGCFKEVFQCVSRVFERSSKGIPWKFKICFKGVSRKFKGCSKKDFRVLQGSFNEVLFCDCVLACISSQLPEQKEGLLP